MVHSIRKVTRALFILALLMGLVGPWFIGLVYAQSADLSEAERLNNRVLEMYRQGKYNLS